MRGLVLCNHDSGMPAGRLAAFERIRDPLIGRPMVAKGEMLPREFGAAEARVAAQGIVDLLAAEMGGL